VAQDLKRKTLQELPSIGREVPLKITAYFSSQGDQALRQLFEKLSAAAAK